MKYEVSILETEHWYEVEAGSEEEAENKAWDLYLAGDEGELEIEAEIGIVRKIEGGQA